MAIQVIPTPTKPTPEQLVAGQIDRELHRAASNLKDSYTKVMALVNKNNKLTPDAVYAAFVANTSTGMSATDLGNAARIIKAVLATYNITIDDSVTPATINL